MSTATETTPVFPSSHKFFETEEENAARLAQAPVGSKNHDLSQLPINIKGDPKDLIIELAKVNGTEHRIVVVPIELTDGYDYENHPEGTPFPINTGTWKCAVVYSDHPSYKVQGYRLSISEDELSRGTQISL